MFKLPDEKHSHGLRRMAAIEASRGSLDAAREAKERSTGCSVGKRQVEELTDLTVGADALGDPRPVGPGRLTVQWS